VTPGTREVQAKLDEVAEEYFAPDAEREAEELEAVHHRFRIVRRPGSAPPAASVLGAGSPPRVLLTGGSVD